MAGEDAGLRKALAVRAPPSGATSEDGGASSSTARSIPPHLLAATPVDLGMEANRPNFSAHGKAYRFAPVSLGCFPIHSKLRQRLLWLVTSKPFENLVLTLIVLNSISLGMVDFSTVDPETYQPVTEGSWCNQFASVAETVFLGLFTVELLLKVAAMGLVLDKGCYLRDPWNWLDFVVVAGGLLNYVPGTPSVGMLRTLRVLRPLRGITAVPRLRMQVTSLLNSMPQLLNLLVLAAFVFVVYGILGVQLWRGVLERRCRLTPFPVLLPPGEVEQHLDTMRAYAEGDPAALAYAHALMTDRARYPYCADPPNSSAIIPLDDASWTQESSPWAVRRDCVWPLATNQTRNCNPNGEWATHSCLVWQTCGSNYDAFGNPRFADPQIMRSATFIEELSWGYIGFDTILVAFLTLFQCVTMEGWTNFAYRIMDTYSSIPSIIFFTSFVVIGAFFLLNLTLGILTDQFRESKLQVEREHRVRRRWSAIRAGGRRGGSVSDDRSGAPSTMTRLRASLVDGALVRAVGRAKCACLTHLSQTRPVRAVVEPCHRLVTHPAFEAVIMFLIFVNTVVLALDSHPTDPGQDTRLENINFVLTVMFGLEMVLKLVGLGVRTYVADSFNRFDALVVFATFVELALEPPSFTDNNPDSSSLSALRLFRLLRLFKLARSWTSLQVLLSTMARTLVDVANFGLLLLLFIYVYALVGMQLFANRMRFDPDTGEPLTLTDPMFHEVEPPRENFDTLFWSCVTVFLLAAEENWPSVMHNAHRATGWGATLYFVTCITLGDLILINLFVAIMLSNFEGEGVKEMAKPVVGPKRASVDSARSRTSSDPIGDARREHRASAPLLTATVHKVPMEPSPSSAPDSWSQAGGVEEGTDRATLTTSDDASASPRVGADEQERWYNGDGEVKGDGTTAGKEARPREKPASVLPPGPLRRLFGSSKVSPVPARATAPPPQAGAAEVVTARGSGTSRVAPTLGDDGAKSGASGATREPSPADPAGKAEVDTADGGDPVPGDSPGERGPVPLEGRSLGVFGPKNPLRVGLSAIVQTKTFEGVILVLIVVAALALAADNPLLDPDSVLVQALHIADIALTAIFTLEMVAKLIVFGLVQGPNAYLRNGWNVLDGTVVLVSVLSLALESVSEFKALRSLRTLRALRPLRVIARYPGLRVVVNTLFRSMPSVMNVAMVCFVFYVIFAIVGISYFKGRFSACGGPVFDNLTSAQETLVVHPVPYTDLSAAQKAWAPNASYEEATSKAVCSWLGADWEQVIPESFNGFPQAMLTLFELTTTEGWPDVMHAGVDATGIDMQPRRNHAPGWAMFFVGFIVMGSFFMLNLFVGAVVDTYNRMNDEAGGYALLTETQREWVRIQEVMMRIKPFRMAKRPTGLQGHAFDLVRHPAFEWTIMACILLNTLVMAANHFGEPHSVTEVTVALNYAFAAIFTLEAAVKIFALRRDYFRDYWNIFDFAIVVGTNTGIAVQLATGVSVGTIATALRTFRVGRILRLVHRAKTLRALFNSLLLALPGLGNIVALLFLLVFIFAVIGVQLFATLQLGDSLNEQANFRTFWLAAFFLLRAITGEDWNAVMHEMARRPEGCVKEPPYDPNVCGFSDHEGCIPLNGCGSVVAYPYMVVFTMVVSFVLLNLFVAIVMDSFSSSNNEEESQLTEEQFRDFVSHWTRFDPDATCFMRATDLKDFFQDLPPPMGFGPGEVATRVQLQRHIASLHLPTYVDRATGEDAVFFTEVALALSHRIMRRVASQRGDALELPENHTVRNKWERRFEYIKGVRAGGVNTYTLSQIFATKTIETTYRGFKLGRRAGRRPGDSRVSSNVADSCESRSDGSGGDARNSGDEGRGLGAAAAGGADSSAKQRSDGGPSGP